MENCNSEKKRSANFTEQECLLLMELLGEVSEFTPNLTRFQFLKHKFTNGVTSKSKREQWMLIHEKFISCSGTKRSVEELEKKVNNLIQKHRNLYCDYKRSITQTGRGPRQHSLSFLTETVMAVVGKESVGVAGVVTGNQTDSTMMALANRRNDCHENNSAVDDSDEELEQVEETENETQSPVHARKILTVSQGSKYTVNHQPQLDHCTRCCISNREIHQLKKRKLQLEIKLLEKKLKEE